MKPRRAGASRMADKLLREPNRIRGQNRRWFAVFFAGIALAAMRALPAAAQEALSSSPPSNQILVQLDSRSGWPMAATLVERVKSRDAALLAELGQPADAQPLVLLRIQPSLLAELPASDPRVLLHDVIVLTYADSNKADAAAALLALNPSVVGFRRSAAFHYFAPNDPLYTNGYAGIDPQRYQWGAQRLHLAEAWDMQRGYGYAGLLDNGIQIHGLRSEGVHEDLRANYRAHFSRNFDSANGAYDDSSHGNPRHGGGPNTPDNLDEEPYNVMSGTTILYPNIAGHGTHTAGIIAAQANNSLGVAGACQGCSLALGRITSWYDPSGTNYPNSAHASAGLSWMTNLGSQVVNMSFGAGEQDFGCTGSMTYVCLTLDAAALQDMAVVAAGGNQRYGAPNNGAEKVQFPASYPGVIAVAGVQYDPNGAAFWDGSGTGVNAFGSNRSSRTDIAAPASDVISSVYTGTDWNPLLRCGDNFPAAYFPGYGDCTGTSMAAPHITGILQLYRSTKPTAPLSEVKAALTSNTTPCVGSLSTYCGPGVPDAARLVRAALGSPAAANRTTPLFMFYSTVNGTSDPSDHFYTVVPQMATAAILGTLLPRPLSGQQAIFGSQGPSTPGYTAFPGLPNPCTGFSPPCANRQPRALVSVLTTFKNPIPGGPDLLPLYRLSWTCPGLPCFPSADHISHVYATDTTERWVSQVGYTIDGIEGYVYPKSVAQPPGTVKLCRKYDGARDDYVLFAGAGAAGTDCSATSDGYTGGHYTDLDTLADANWIGWAYPAAAPSAVCAGGISCSLSPTTTTLATSANPSTLGATVTFTATVGGVGPTGAVAFTSDAVTMSGCGAVVLVRGAGTAPSTATCSTSSLTAGSHSVVATYGGDASNAGSASSPLVQVVSGGGTLPPPTALKRFTPASIAPGASSTLTVTLNPKLLYVAGNGDNTLIVVDSATGTVLATIPVGTAPYYTAVNAAGGRAYVTNNGSATVSVLDTATNGIIASIGVGAQPTGVAVSSSRNVAYVTNYGSSTVSVLNTATNSLSATVIAGSNPINVAMNPAGTRAYVSNMGSATVSVFDTTTNSAIATIPVGAAPRGIVVHPAGTFAYVVSANVNRLSVIDTASNAVVATAAVGSYPTGVALSPAGTRAYVANYNGGSVSVFDTALRAVIKTISVSANPFGVAVNPAGTKVYVSCPTAITVIDSATNTVVGTFPAGRGPSLQANSIVAPFPSATTGVAFTDIYPTGLVNTAAASPATTCGGTVTAANNGHSVALSGGTIPANSSCTVTVHVTSASAGSYLNSTGPIASANAGAGAAASATLTVAPQPPTATLTAPAAGQMFAAPATVNLAATAASPNTGGSINKVEFYKDNGATPLFTDTLAPYAYSWIGVPAGSYALTAKAYDDRNVSTTSAVVPIAVCGLPAVALTSPTPGQTVGAPGAFTLTATASVASGCGAIQKVVFYNGTTLLKTVITPPYTYAWSGVPVGDYTVKARAYDALSQTNEASVTVHVTGASNQPPVIGSATPAATQVVLGGNVSFSVMATDPDAGDTVVAVRLFNGAALVGTAQLVAANTFVVSWNPPSPGTFALTLQATDSHGASATQAVSVTVIAPPVSASPNPAAVIPGFYATPSIGTMAGSFGVGDSGAASYTIPVQVPPGTAGMQPSLALTYNSQGGNGLLGVGWSLSGLSVITRCPKTEAQDGMRTGINYDNDETNDVYCLDGQRLVLVGGPIALTDDNYGSGTAAFKYEYRTELDGYAKIEGYQEQTIAALASPYRFRVWAKSGQVLDYGSRWWIISRGWDQNHPLTGRVNVAKQWVLDRVIDRSGNFIEIDYADRDYEAHPDDPYYDRGVLHLATNCSRPPSVAINTAQPVGAYPNVEYWPTAIRYYAQGSVASACGSSLNNQVRFTYEDVPSQLDPPTRDRYYDSGAGQTSLSRRLTRIDTNVDATGLGAGTPVKSYTLSYASSQQTGRSILQSVRECSADGACLPPTQFEWAQKDWNATGHSFVGPPVDLPIFFSAGAAYVADWNGDGISDLIGWSNEDGPGGSVVRKLFVCLGTTTPAAGFDCGIQPLLSLAAGQPSIRPEFMDMNGDGRADLAYRTIGGQWVVCLSDGHTGCTPAGGTWPTSSFTAPGWRGDMDGDGKLDIINYLGNGVFQTCITNGSANGSTCYTQDLSYPNYPYSPCGTYPGEPTSGCESFSDPNVQYQVLVADVNGDGKADLIRRRTDSDSERQWKVCFSDFGPGRTNTYRCHDRWVQSSTGRVDQTTTYDFNGDGIADMASTQGQQQGGTTTWTVCLSTGDGAFEFTDPNVHWDRAQQVYVDGNNVPVDYYNSSRCRSWTGTGLSNDTKVIYGDFNGDGRTDLASWDGSTNSWRVCLSTGSDFSCSNWQGPILQGSNPDLSAQVLTGDFNGDGKTDILLLRADGTAQLTLSTGPQTGDVLTKITTGLNATTQITYAPLTDATVYAKGTGAVATSREVDIQSPMYVVKQTQASNGVGGNFANDYFYENLRGRTDGRGLYGFNKKRVRDGNGIVTESQYLRVAAASYATYWPIVGRPAFLRKYAPSTPGYVADITQVAAFDGTTSLFGGQLIMVNRVTSSWDVRASQTCNFSNCSGAPTVKEAFQTQTIEESWELGGAGLPSMTTAIGSFDQYGNAQLVTASTSDGYVKATANTYVNDNANWVLGRLTSATVTMTKPGAGSVQRKSAFTYQGLGGSCAGAAYGYLCDEIIEPDFANDGGSSYSLWQQTGYQYDNFGNRVLATLQFKERDGTPKTRSTTTGFGYNGRFPTTLVNALGQQETRQFDTRFGTMTRQQGPNGIATVGLYDGFGRKYGERALDANGSKVSETFSPVELAGLQGFERYRTRTQISGGGEAQTYFDELQRAVRAVTRAFNSGTYAQGTTTYDALGRMSQSTKPAGPGTVTTTQSYDVLNRPTQELVGGAGMSLTSQYSYATFGSLVIDGQTVGGGRAATVTQNGTRIVARTTVKYTNSQGQSVRVTDGEAGNTDFSFDVYGNLAKTIGPTGISEQMGYDRRGRKVSLSNPDSGAWSYQYNGAGELVLQVDAKGQNTRMFYDPLGRTIERREHPGSEATLPFVTVSSYDRYADASQCTYGVGRLCEARTATVGRGTVGGTLANPETRTYTAFDAAGRAIRGTSQIDGKSFVSMTTFDPNGRIDKLVYPSGFMVVHRYTAWSGQLDRIAEWTGTPGTVHWQANSRFADGQIQTMLVGNVSTNKGYDGFGRVATVQTGGGGIQNGSYGFDALGNLTSRADAAAGQGAQSFAYDRVNRLTSDGVTTVSYDAGGNILNKGGTYGYFGGTHRLQSAAGYGYSYDANGNVAQITGGAGSRALTYTAFNLPSSITGPTGSVSYVHDAAHARIKEVSQGASSSGTTYYLGAFEEHTRSSDTTLEQRHYLSTAEGAIGIVTLRSNGQNDARYWHKDHIGSIAVITDAAGSVKETFSYDAWGNRNVIVHATGDPYDEERGFTGHEQLVEVGLTHMNGRIYDPVTGRFLQADPIVQNPLNGQNYNRYGYVLNNPLSFTDPTGFSWWTKWRRPIFAIAAAVLVPELLGAWANAGVFEAFTAEQAALINTINVVGPVAGGFAAGGIQGGNIESAIQGALFAGLDGGIGDITSGATGASIFGNGAFAANVGLHAALGCAQEASAGGSCRAGALSGSFSAFAGPFVQGPQPMQFLAHVAIGGLAARLAGDKFENGAITAAFAYLFNCSRHPCSPDEIKEKAASCIGPPFSFQCASEVVREADEAGMLRGPAMGRKLLAFEDFTTLPVRIATPWGRAADLGLDVLGVALSVINGTSDWIGIAAGFDYGEVMKWALEPVGREFGARAGAIAGKVFEAIVDDMMKEPKQNGQGVSGQ